MKATGNLNKWCWPKLPGLEKFQGDLIHPANWKEDYDPTGKRVAVIGYGATAVQLVPAILPQVQYMDHYVRGQAWISPAGYVAADPRKANNPDIHNCKSMNAKLDIIAKAGQSLIHLRRERNTLEIRNPTANTATQSRTTSTRFN